jgi:hypothetical protein
MMVKEGDTTGGKAGLAKLLRSSRIVRLFRLLRAAKLKRLIRKLVDWIETEEVFLMFSVLMVLAALVFSNHLIAAVWYFVGDVMAADTANWIDEFSIQSKPVFYQYTVALGFSISNFGLGSSPIHAQNGIEGLFSVALVVLGMLTFTIVLGMITTWMVQLQSSKDDTSKQLWQLRRFFRENSVGRSLSFKILRYLEYKVDTSVKKVPETKLEVLNLLSESLRIEFRYSISYSAIRAHALFEQAERREPAFIYKMATTCFSLKAWAKDDAIFKSRTMFQTMHVISVGRLSYTKKDETVLVQRGDWFSEQNLWVEGWLSRGGLVALDDCQIVTLKADAIQEAVQENECLWAIMTSYALKFFEWLMEDPDDTDHFSAESGQLRAQGLLKDALDAMRSEMGGGARAFEMGGGARASEVMGAFGINSRSLASFGVASRTFGFSAQD